MAIKNLSTILHHQANGTGTGLGLSLSYDIVKAHGGEEINVQRKRGGGRPGLLFNYPLHRPY